MSQETVKSPWETRFAPLTNGTVGLFQTCRSLASPGRLAGGGRSPREPVCGVKSRDSFIYLGPRSQRAGSSRGMTNYPLASAQLKNGMVRSGRVLRHPMRNSR